MNDVEFDSISARQEPVSTHEGRQAVMDIEEGWLAPFASIDIETMNDRTMFNSSSGFEPENVHIMADLVVGNHNPIIPIAAAEQMPFVSNENEQNAALLLVRHAVEENWLLISSVLSCYSQSSIEYSSIDKTTRAKCCYSSIPKNATDPCAENTELHVHETNRYRSCVTGSNDPINNIHEVSETVVRLQCNVR